MAKLTREQYEKWTAQAHNGFYFDVKYYVCWNEKTLRKTVEMPNGDVIEFKIEYDNEFETRTNEYGCKWNVKTGRFIPMLYIHHWRPSTTPGVYHSNGAWAKRERIGEIQDKKKYNVLCNLSAGIDTDEYMKEFIDAA